MVIAVDANVVGAVDIMVVVGAVVVAVAMVDAVVEKIIVEVVVGTFVLSRAGVAVTRLLVVAVTAVVVDIGIFVVTV